jgi:hypothetical protein
MPASLSHLGYKGVDLQWCIPAFLWAGDHLAAISSLNMDLVFPTGQVTVNPASVF